MTKRFLPGTLNPLYEGDSPYDLDLEEFNNSNYVKELEKKILEKSLEQDLLAGMTSPHAVILGPAKFSFQNPQTDYAVPVHSMTADKMYTWYYFRIPEIHSHLVDPCNPRLVPNKAEVYKAIHDHPIAPFIPPDDNITQTQISPGSVVEISYDRGPDVGMALFPKIVKVVSKAYGLLNIDQSCQSILDAFSQEQGFSTVGGTSGPSGPFSSYSFPAVASCSPKNVAASNLKDYFGATGYEKVINEIAGKESGGTLAPNTLGVQPPQTNSDGTDSIWKDYPASSIDGVNYAGYSGKYQVSVDIIKSAGYLKSTVAGCSNQRPPCQDKIMAHLANDNNWAGQDGIDSIGDFLKSEKAQLKTMANNSEKNFQSLKPNDVDLNSPQDVAGMLAAAHLKGVQGARDMRSGSDNADANSQYASNYYKKIGGKCPTA